MKALSVWARRDPFADFDALVRGFGERGFGDGAVSFVPAAEAHRDGDDAVVRLELPGLDFEHDVTVEVERGQLVVRGERRDERKEEKEGRSLREVRYGSFYRSFDLPAHVAADDVTASYDKGVLVVRVAGAYRGTQPTRITVTGSSN